MVELYTQYTSGLQFTAGTVAAGSVTGASGINDITRQINTNTTAATAATGSIVTLYGNFDTSTGHDHDGNDSKKLDWDSCWADAVHNHTTNAEGGTITVSNLDWDTCWSDAVHSHASDAEGGILTISDTSDLQNNVDNISDTATIIATATDVATGGNNTLIIATGVIYWDTPGDGMYVLIYRDDDVLNSAGQGGIQFLKPIDGNNSNGPFSIALVDSGATGTHTYTLRMQAQTGSSNDAQYTNLVVIPLKT